jgi:hypothetical protein
MATIHKISNPQEDPLIRDLLDAKNHVVEVIAFGIAYHGLLKDVNLEYGFVTVVDGGDKATLELERIESFRLVN